MAGTTKTTKIATLEDVTRRCSVGIAARASMLEEGIGHARQAKGHVADAEQHVSTGLGALQAVKPAFAGTSEYMLTCTRLLNEVSNDLENDIAELRQIQVSIASFEEPTADVLQQMLSYSVDAIQSRIRTRMNKLGGDFSMPMIPRPAVNLRQIGSPPRRRPESLLPPPREFSLNDIDDGMAMDTLMQAGLENFERGGALLESCFDSLQLAQVAVAHASRSLEALTKNYRAIEEMEAGSNASEINGAIAQLERLVHDVELISGRLERIGGASERTRSPLLAIFENMGRLLVSGVMTESNPAEARDVSAKELLQQALRGDTSGIEGFASTADESQLQAMSDALYHSARTQDLEAALYAVEALRSLALSAGGARTEAGDNLLSLSNSLSVPEAVRSAATAALIDLTDGSGVAQ
jgi:exonuclease VII small subunit